MTSQAIERAGVNRAAIRKVLTKQAPGTRTAKDIDTLYSAQQALSLFDGVDTLKNIPVAAKRQLLQRCAYRSVRRGQCVFREEDMQSQVGTISSSSSSSSSSSLFACLN